MAGEKKSGSGHTAHVIQAAGAVVAALVTIGPGIYGIVKGQGPAQPYVVVFDAVTGKGGGSSAQAAEAPTVYAALPLKPAEPAPQPAPPPPPAAPKALPPEGLAMQRMSSDPRLSMRVMSAQFSATHLQSISLRLALTAQGQAALFTDINATREGWSVDGDKAGHCWQTQQSGLPEFASNALAGNTGRLASLDNGQTLSIRADYQCDNPVTGGDTITVTATPTVADTANVGRSMPVRFQSAPLLAP